MRQLNTYHSGMAGYLMDFGFGGFIGYGKGTIALWKKVRAFLDEEFPEAAMVSEWGEPDKSLQGGISIDFKTYKQIYPSCFNSRNIIGIVQQCHNRHRRI